MQFPGTKPLKVATLGLALLSLLSCWSTIAASALTTVDDSAATLPNTPVVIPVLMNDAVSTSNTTAILRVTQPSHGRVIRNSTPTSHAELTPLFGFAATQLSNAVVQVAITNLYPWYLTNGVWKSIPTNTPVNPDQNWIGGFFPGSLWMIYEQTGDANFSHWAQMWQAALAPEQYSTAKDDVGFIINSSFGNGYRITGNPQYKDILTQTRRSFTNRWNSVVGCLADDRLLTPPPFEVDIDTMMNTEIFYRADLDRDTNMLAMAISHAGRTLTNHLRADGSTFMRVIYDGVTNGAVLLKDNRVPIGALDTWARGHSWATHSFALLYGATGDGRFLDTAKRVADFYISNAPADYVPYWYYPSTGPDTTLLRDSSAAAVTLSGLLDLSQQVTNDSDGVKYWLAAHRLFASLSSTNYLATNTTNAILLHANPVDANTDTSVIYGDYYFIESLKRFNDLFNQTTLTYIPATNFTGTDSFTYQACDSSGAVSTATVTVTVGSGPQVYTVAVSALPVAGGSVSGGGTFAAGSSVTVTATANTGYQFANWTEGATVVSGSASYTFPLSGNRTLVANFSGPVIATQNGSFESDYSGWTETGNQHITTGPPFPASDGTKAVVFSDGDRTPNGVLSQSFTTSPGQGYTVTFDVGVIGYNLNEQRLKVMVTGSSTLLSQTVSLFADGTGVLRWTTRSYSFVADSASATLTFLDQSPTTASLDITLDNVRVAAASGPVIATQPSSATVTVGGSASFSVVAAGSSLTYQWRFNGVAIGGATASSYTKANVQTTDAGNYDVLVSNGSATVASAVAVLTVVQPGGLINGSFESDYSGWTETGNQHITTGPPFPASDGTKAVVFSDGDRTPNGVLSQSFTTSPGQSYTVTFDVGVIGYNLNEQRLKVMITGSSTLLSQTVSLFADGTGVLRWTTRSYSFVADSATATLTFQDQSPTTASLDITLDHVRVTAASGPVIATQPSSATVTVGGSASFSVVAAGSSLTYQWRFNGVAIAGATASSYTKANVQTTDAGNYDVLVSNGSATVASAVAVLTVVQPGGLINGSFESDYSGWTETGNQHITTGPPFTASDGTKAVVFSDGDRTPNGVLSQSFTTSPGQGYTVTFDVGVIGYNRNEQRLKVMVTGSSPLLSQTVSLFADGTGVLRWTTRSYSFVADSATATLTFQDQSPTTASLDITLDNVRVALQSLSVITNGSFESDYSGWTETGNQHITTGPPFPASDGTKAVVFSDGDRTPNGVLSQSFTTSPGQGYTVTFDVGVIGYNLNEQRLKVMITGSSALLSQTVSLFADGTGVLRWTTRSYSFVADSATATLTFLDQSPTTASLDITLDNVRVTANVVALTAHAGASSRSSGLMTLSSTVSVKPSIPTAPTVQSSARSARDEASGALFTLKVGSISPRTGVRVPVSPSDEDEAVEGVTGFTLHYSSGAVATIRAPWAAGGGIFSHWERDGVDVGSSVELSVTMDGDHQVDAVYQPASTPPEEDR